MTRHVLTAEWRNSARVPLTIRWSGPNEASRRLYAQSSRHLVGPLNSVVETVEKPRLR